MPRCPSDEPCSVAHGENLSSHRDPRLSIAAAACGKLLSHVGGKTWSRVPTIEVTGVIYDEVDVGKRKGGRGR